MVTRQPWIRRISRKVRRLQTDVLTAEPRRQPTYTNYMSTRIIRVHMHTENYITVVNVCPRQLYSPINSSADWERERERESCVKVY